MFVQIMEDIEYYDIPVYNFPYDVEEDDEETIQDNSELRVSDVKWNDLDSVNGAIIGHDAILHSRLRGRGGN